MCKAKSIPNKCAMDNNHRKTYFQLQKHILGISFFETLSVYIHETMFNTILILKICLSLTLNLAINICLDCSGFHILWPVQACFLQGCIRQHFNVCKFIGWVDKYCIYRPNNISTNIEMTLLSKLCWLCKCNEIFWSKTFSFLKISFFYLFQHSPKKRE